MKYRWIKGPVILTILLILIILIVWLISLIPVSYIISGAKCLGLLSVIIFVAIIIYQLVVVFKKPKK